VRYDELVAHTALHPFAAALLTVSAATAAYDPTLDSSDIAGAIRIGQSATERVRADYHRPYRIDIGRPPVDYIELVTPFRRVELAVEERARIGERRFSQREALEALAEQGGRLTLLVELTFHPQNAYVGVPSYGVALAEVESADRVSPVDVQRVPRFGARVAGTALPYPRAPVTAGGNQPMLGGTVIAAFEGARLDPRGAYDVVIEEAGKELARARIDLGRLR